MHKTLSCFSLGLGVALWVLAATGGPQLFEFVKFFGSAVFVALLIVGGIVGIMLSHD